MTLDPQSLEAQPPEIRARVERMRASDDRALREWAAPSPYVFSGHRETIAPTRRTDDQLVAVAIYEEAAFRAWYAAPAQVADRARVQAIHEREEADNAAFLTAIGPERAAAWAAS